MVFLGEISYEIFLIHLLTMELVMVEIVRYPIYTGSIAIAVRGDVRRDSSGRLAAAPVHPRPLRLGAGDTGDPTAPARVRLSCPK